MNSTIEAVNSAAETWWPYVLHVSWQATVVAAVVLLVVRFGRRMPAVVRSALVLIGFAKFLFPPVLPLPMGVFSQLDFEDPGTVAAEERESASFENGSLADPVSPHGIGVAADRSNTDNLTGREPETRTDPLSDSPRSFSNSSASSTVPATSLVSEVIPESLSWQSWLMLLQGWGTLLVAGWIALTAIRLQRMRRASEVIETGRIREDFNSVARELKIRRTIGLRVSEDDIPPMAFGVLCPTVLLPASLVDELNAEELKTICAHELAHHRRRDPLMNFVQAVVLAVWWFNPLLWLLNRVAREVREDCCDDLILTRGLTTATVYCQVLMGMAERLADRVRPTSPLACAQQMHPVQARMLRVMDSSLPRAPRLSLRGFAAVLVVAALLLPGMSGLSGGPDKEEESAEPRQASDSSAAETARQDVYVDPLPAGALVRLGTIRYRHNSGDQHPVGGFLSDGTYVSRTTSSARIGFWDVRTGLRDSKRPEIDLGDQHLRQFRILPDGETIVTLGFRFNRNEPSMEQVLQFWNKGVWSKAIEWVELQSSVNTLACAPDGTTIVTGSSQGELRFWDRGSGTVLLTHQFPALSIEAIAFSPDGESLAVAGYRGAFLWEWLTGKEPVPLEGLESGAHALTFSPDGRLLATGSDDDTGARLWEVKTQRLHKTLEGNADRHYPDRIAFTSDGQFLAVPTRDYSIELWNVSTGQIAHNFETGSIEPRLVTISPDDRRLVAAAWGPTMIVWDLKTRERLATPPGHSAHVGGIAFTPDGKQVVTSSDDHTVRIWNAETGQQERKLQHERWVRDVAVSPDGKLIASNSLDDTVGVWNLDSGKQIYRLFGHGRLGGRRAVSFSPDGKLILTWGDNMAMRVWDVETGKALTDFPLRPAGATITEDENGEAKIGDPTNFSFRLQGGTFTHDGQRLLLAWGKTLSIFDVSTGKELLSLQMERSLRGVSSSSGSHLLATIVAGKPENVLQIRSAETGEVRREMTLPEGGYYRRAVFSPDDKLIAVVPGSTEEGILVFEIESGQLRYLINGIPAAVSVMAFSPDGSRLATALSNTTVLIWNLRDFQVNNE